MCRFWLRPFLLLCVHSLDENRNSPGLISGLHGLVGALNPILRGSCMTRCQHTLPEVDKAQHCSSWKP